MIDRPDLNLDITGLTCASGEYYCIDFVAYHLGVKATRRHVMSALPSKSEFPFRGAVIIYWKGIFSDQFGIMVSSDTVVSKGELTPNVREHGIYELSELGFDYMPRITYHIPNASAKANLERFLQRV